VKTICLDFNGVLDMYQGWKGPDYMYPMRPGAKEFLMKLNQLEYNVIVLTATADRNKVWSWLIDNGINNLVYDVTNVKPPAMVYLDDRGVTFNGSFDEALEAIKTFRAHWE
jgi:hypothetical protein